MEWNWIRLCGHTHGIVTETEHEKAAKVTFYLSKLGFCAVNFSQISSKFKEEVVY